MNKMLGMMGKSVEDLMTGEQIQKLLIKTFNKFDEDGSGEMEYPEFKQAYFALGLNGSEAEIREAFKKVDVDNSGKVDRVEFSEAVKGSRMAELSLNVLVEVTKSFLFFSRMRSVFTENWSICPGNTTGDCYYIPFYWSYRVQIKIYMEC